MSFVAVPMCFAIKACLVDIYVVVLIKRCHWELWMLALWPDLVNHALQLAIVLTLDCLVFPVLVIFFFTAGKPCGSSRDRCSPFKAKWL